MSILISNQNQIVFQFLSDLKKRIFKMAMSGVEVDPECKVAYDETLMGHMYRYVTFKIDDGKIRIDKVNLQSLGQD